MRYHEFSNINELFKNSTSVPFTLVQIASHKYNAEFKIDQSRYRVEFDEEHVPKYSDDGGAWELVFFMIDSQDPRNYKLDNTGTGNEFIVYNTVLSITKSFIAKMQPALLSFTGENGGNKSGRGGLYTKMLTHLKDDLTKLGYTADNPSKYGLKTFFTISRNDLND